MRWIRMQKINQMVGGGLCVERSRHMAPMYVAIPVRCRRFLERSAFIVMSDLGGLCCFQVSSFKFGAIVRKFESTFVFRVRSLIGIVSVTRTRRTNAPVFRRAPIPDSAYFRHGTARPRSAGAVTRCRRAMLSDPCSMLREIHLHD